MDSEVESGIKNIENKSVQLREKSCTCAFFISKNKEAISIEQ